MQEDLKAEGYTNDVFLHHVPPASFCEVPTCRLQNRGLGHRSTAVQEQTFSPYYNCIML